MLSHSLTLTLDRVGTLGAELNLVSVGGAVCGCSVLIGVLSMEKSFVWISDMGTIMA